MTFVLAVDIQQICSTFEAMFLYYIGFRLIGSPVNWGIRLFGANPGELKPF
jgi:hypothetical protein